MADNLALAQRFYSAMQNLDLDGLRETLARDFVLHVADGLPEGLGGRHDGPDAAITEVWQPAYLTFRVLPYPDELLAINDGRVVVVGNYRGTPPATERAFTASFAHILRFHDGKITELQQITDTRCWEQALSPS